LDGAAKGNGKPTIQPGEKPNGGEEGNFSGKVSVGETRLLHRHMEVLLFKPSKAKETSRRRVGKGKHGRMSRPREEGLHSRPEKKQERRASSIN